MVSLTRLKSQASVAPTSPRTSPPDSHRQELEDALRDQEAVDGAGGLEAHKIVMDPRCSKMLQEELSSFSQFQFNFRGCIQYVVQLKKAVEPMNIGLKFLKHQLELGCLWSKPTRNFNPLGVI